MISKIKCEYPGRTDWIGSDSTSKIILDPMQRTPMPIQGIRSFLEECDLRNMPPHWKDVEFDDSEWETPRALDSPLKNLILDENAPLYERLHVPETIVNVGECDDKTYELEPDEIEGMDFNTLQGIEDPPTALTNFEITNIAGILSLSPSKTEMCEIRPKPGGQAAKKAISIYVKFDKEYVGYPQILVEGEPGTTIDVMMEEKDGGYCPDYIYLVEKNGFRLILREGTQFYEQWAWKGFQYMLLKIRNLTGTLKIHSLRVNQTHMKISEENRGKFVCDKEDLNKLWSACAYTLLCCGIDAYIDCPQREQRCYLGDAYVESLVTFACFGEPRLTKKVIFDACMGQRDDGLFYSFHPGDAPSENHVIPDYSLYLIQLTMDSYLYFGDEALLTQTYPHYLKVIDWFWQYLDETDGLLVKVPFWNFIDWSFPRPKPGKWAIINAQFKDALKIMATLSHKFGRADLESKFAAQAEKMTASIEKTFWDAHERCYRDYILEDGSRHGFSYSTNSYLILKDIVPQEKYGEIFARIFEFPGSEANIAAQIDEYYDQKVSQEVYGKRFEDKIRVSQPFFMHHVHQMFAKVGRFDLMLLYITKWIPMLKIGTTGTIWETWSNNASQCHAWSTTPAYDLSTHWLGVKPLLPGFASVEISPTFHGLEKVEGTFPTCKGNIDVRWEKLEGNRIEIVIDLPKTITRGILKVPPFEGKPPTAKAEYALTSNRNAFVIDYAGQ